MFNIENYIAPLILSKVEKFVKNINQNEFKVSLWQGDVVFQNLELKLDALEEELQHFPFTFLSGHVANLKIQIPWTKIASEAITITINTLELVVRLKDFAASSPPPQKKKLKKKISMEEDQQAAGYMASLIAKIVNNISVICNNICIKFIEEDIVFSMNIQHLSIYSADTRWRRAFVDVSSSATNVLFRKLINIIDLTICLDKRNASGKIEFVQEPFLYKCSMELRMFRKAAKFSITRIDLQTKSLNMTISSQQLPMLWRLIDLVLVLKSGRLQAKFYGNMPSHPSVENLEQDEESWIGWMWNMLPAILPDEQENDENELDNKTIFEFGVYIEDMTVTLKAQEFISDIIPSTKKAIFKPLLEIHAKEIYSTTIICGRRKFNVKGGAEYLKVSASDECPCGAPTNESMILCAGNNEPRGEYLINSYFDKNSKSQVTKYEDIMNNYYEKFTEDHFLTRSSAIAFDIFHSIEIPDEARSSDLGSDLEFSNLSESHVIRTFGNGFKINVNTDAIHRIEKIMQYYKDCDILPYVEEDKVLLKSQLSPATADDYDALINEVPIKVIRIKLKNSSVFINEWNHERSTKGIRKYTRQSSAYGLATKKNQVTLEVKIDEMITEIKAPLYKNRLVYTTCQLPDSVNNELFKKCFLTIDLVFKNVKLDMKFEGCKRICEILKMSTSMRNLIYPHLWEENDIKKKFIEMEVNGISLMMNPPQLLVTSQILSSMIMRSCNSKDIEKSLLQDLCNSELVVIQVTSRILTFGMCEMNNVILGGIKISDLIGIAWKSGVKSIVFNIPDNFLKSPRFSSKEKKSKNAEKMLKISFQFPKEETESEQQKLVPVVTMKTSEGCVNLDPLLREFLSFKIILEEEVKTEKRVRTLSTSTKPILTGSNNQLNSIQSSSDCDVTICPPAAEKEVSAKKDENFLDKFEIFKNYILNIEIKSLHIYYSSAILESSKASDSINAMIQQSKTSSLALKLPTVLFHSVKNKSFAELVSSQFLDELPITLWGNEKCFTWNLVLDNCRAYTMDDGKRYDVISETSFNISIADENSSVIGNKIAGNLLIETSPISITFRTSQVALLKEAIKEIGGFQIFRNLWSNSHQKVEDEVVKIQEKLEAIEECPQNASDIKEFLGLATASTITRTTHADEKMRNSKLTVNFYVQWICSKINLVLIADTINVNKKLMIEIDELLVSLHQQDYYQLKSKIASISGNLYEKNVEEKWSKSLNLGFNVQSETPDSTGRFFDMIITKAETANVHSKWNVDLKRHAKLILNDVSEINLTFQPFDVIADMDELMNFLPIFTIFQGKNEPPEKTFIEYSGSELPLLYLNCNGFRIFFPCLMKSSTAAVTNDVLIVKVNSFQISPNAVNNLIRNQILRPDIHSKASMLGVLDLVGSKTEDRQYQLLIKGLSLSSSNWNEIASLMIERNIQGYDNPAERWNNLENGPTTNFQFNTIFKDSSFSFIYAPSIKFKQTLVAGTAIEINCVNDLNIVMTTDEVMLFINMAKQLSAIGEVFKVKEQAKSPEKSQVQHKVSVVKHMEKKSLEDSGVESSNSYSKSKIKSWQKKISVQSETAFTNVSNFVPFEFTFTSSKFNIKFTIQQNEFNFLLDTPNLYLTQNKYEKSINVSLHNLNVDFDEETIFSTRHGTIDAISGIKPSLMRIKVCERSAKNVDMNIQLKRSMMMEITQENLSKFLSIAKNLESQMILLQRQHSREQKEISHAKLRKFDILKSYTRDIKSASFSTDQICLNLKTKVFGLKFAISNSKGKFKVFERPEKIESSLEISHATLQDQERLIFHPLTAELKVKISQEYWKKDPLIYINLNCNYLKVDVSPELIINLKSLISQIQKVFPPLENTEEENSVSDSENVRKFEIHPKHSMKNSSPPNIEHFQDDLRSGAFQFVEAAISINDLPLPYQIQIIDKDIGVICWRYPSPRALHKIKIFPVPFQSVNQVTIMCKIEYYSQLKNKFEEFMSFTLNENETKILDMKQNKPSAEVWRITIPRVLLKRDSDDEEDSSDYEFEMHPKVLVACLRIDSYYMSNAIASISSYLTVGNVQLNLLNSQKHSPKQHELVKFNLNSLKIVGQSYDEKYENYELEGCLSLDVNDFASGNLIPVVEKFKIKSLIDLHHDDLNLNFISDKIRLRYSSSIGHSLITTVKIWKKSLDGTIEDNFVCTKFTILNNSSSAIAINQVDTSEMICIMPQSTESYQFYTDKLKQHLQLSICIDGLWSCKTEPFQIHHESIEYVKVDENQFFVISIKNTSNYQRKVIINGQVSVYNMTKEFFRVQYKRYDKDINAPDKCEVQEINLSTMGNASVFGTCQLDSQQSIRLRLIKSEKKIFSGEIPLREIVVNNKPWLVKVPSDNGYISFWVRIIRQNINNELCRVLVMIYPMFMTRSLFPCNIAAIESASEQKFIICGKGEARELEMYGTHENDHELLLPDQFIQTDGKPANLVLSYKLINRNSFFKIPDEFSDISKAIEALEEKTEIKWPISKDDEFLCNRNFMLSDAVTTLYELSSQEPAGLSCSLMLTLSPQIMLKNSTGSLIKFTNLSSHEFSFLEANDVITPACINNTFSISMKNSDEWIQSDPIYINTDIKRTISSSYSLPVEGSINVILHHNNESMLLVISSTCEGKLRFISIATMIVIANHTERELKVLPFCAEVGEKVEALRRNEFPVGNCYDLYDNRKNDKFKKGNAISTFTNISFKSKRKFNPSMVNFVAFGVSEKSNFTCPIKIQPTIRKCLNVSTENDSFSINISILKHEEQFFISIFNDPHPILSVKNNTDFNLFVAQTDMKNPSAKYILPHKEIGDEKWISWFQVVPSKQKVFYTPPTLNETFPEIVNPDYGLIFACVCGDEFIRWSLPIKIDETKKIIINVPMFGDLKILVDVRPKTAEITINYIDADEGFVDDGHSDSSLSNLSFVETNGKYKKTFNIAKNSQKIFNLNCFIESVNLTISKDSEDKRLDLISFSVDEISTQFSKVARKLKLNFLRVQVDNELFVSGNYDFPVILCNKNIISKFSDEDSLSPWDIFEFIQRQQQNEENFSLDIDFYEDENSVQNVTLKFQPIRIYIEDTFVNVLLELFDDCLPNHFIYKSRIFKEKNHIKLSHDGLVLIPLIIHDQAQHLTDVIRVRSIHIEALHILLSVHTCIRVYIALDHSPLDFSPYDKFNIYTLPMKLGNSIGMHYLSSAIFGAGWVVGSLEILGSPSGLARSLTSGFKDFVSMPVQGLFRGPWGFLVGLTQGSVSLVRNVTTGTVNSVTKLANSLARNLDRLTLDSDHIYLKTDALRRSRPQGFADGLQQGLTGLGISLLGAIGGLARHPLQAKSAVDIFTGVGKGILGVLTKPISGAAELVALTGTGMLQSVGYNTLPIQMRNHRVDHNTLSEPNAEKIISRQLTQLAETNALLFTCRATFVCKNDLKNALIILLTRVMVIVDLENDAVIDVIMLEKLQTTSAKGNADNLFVFKIRDEKESSSNEQKYQVSSRTVQYIKQLSNQLNAERSSENSGEEFDSASNADVENKISFYIDETTGKYLLNYFNFIKHQLDSRENLFPLFDDAH